jgi:aminoglycoside phosphotransferase (APT) family kinase protein
MKRTPALEHQLLIDQLCPGARVTACQPLAGGVSAEVHAVTFVRPDGAEERVVVRRHRTVAGKPERRERAAREHSLLTVLHARGVPVPRSRLFVAPDTLVQDLIEGDTTLPADAAGPLAEALAAIHAVDPAALPALPRLEDPGPGLREWLPGLEGLEAALARHGPFPGPDCLLHGDYWPGNVLWREGRLAAVLDWEDAAMGDPLSDLACARVELACAAGEGMALAFTDAYLGLTGRDAARLPLWDLYTSTAALTYMDQWGLAPEALAARRAMTIAWQRRALESLSV